MTEPEDRDDDDDFDDEDEEESPPPAKVKPRATVSKDASRTKRSATRVSSGAMLPLSTTIGVGVVALAIGGIGGWFGQIQKAKAAVRAEVAAAPVGSGAPAGPCGAFQSTLCKSAGEQSIPCQQAKAATDVLSSSACESALASMPQTLAKIKAGRASCEKLVTKLCADLPPGSKTCEMVKDRTPNFPRERCDQMLANYDKVIAELKQMDAGGGPPMGGMQRMQPGGMPRITLPPQSAPVSKP